jgi:hypothetical protein
MNKAKNLADLAMETARLERSLAIVKKRRSKASLALAKGDKSQHLSVDDLIKAEKEAAKALESHLLLVEEVKTAQAVAEAGQAAANRERQASLDSEFAAREAEECAAILANFADRRERIIGLWCELST